MGAFLWGCSGRRARTYDLGAGCAPRSGRPRWRPVGLRAGPPAVVRVDGGRERTGRPPNAVRSCLVPASGKRLGRGPIRAPGPRSARGYPAAVTTPVGADPSVVGPYLASALNDERWRTVGI